MLDFSMYKVVKVGRTKNPRRKVIDQIISDNMER